MSVTFLGGSLIRACTGGKKPIFIIFFREKRGQIGKNFKKGCYGHQLGPMTHFLTRQKFDPLLYFLGLQLSYTFAKLPVHALINDPKKKCYRHQL